MWCGVAELLEEGSRDGVGFGGSIVGLCGDGVGFCGDEMMNAE